MKKLITIAAMLIVAATAQGQSKYDNSFKYRLLSNIEVGVGAIYSYEITNQAHNKNTGAQLLLTKRIGDYWRLRGVAEVNGFIANGFDRFGKGMLGISFDLLPFYVYGDYGVNLNPSEKSKFGLAMDGGIGLQFKVGNTASLYVEGGVDRTNNGTKWQSNAEVKAGVLVSTGITEQDRVRKSIDNTMRSEYGELKGENKLLKSELQKCQDATTSIQESAAQMAAMVESLQAQLNESKAEVKTVKENCGKSDFYPIVFDFGSAEITDAMDDYIMDYAEMMRSTTCDYRILGYCSANGTDWKNQILSERRANSVYYRLIAYGVDESRLFPEGKGMSDYDKASEQKVIIVRIER
jgi:outer membrane protein OmpA-like peptidoglycan-associated protein